ncbi:MAG: alpha/beta hydrolase, partial [Chloroflexi bacterium]|nr:alpha/beta hydrolase [Chloroflexota bacterium]
MRYVVNLMLFTIAVAVVGGYGVLPYLGARQTLRPERVPAGRTPASLGWEYEEIAFQGAGVRLAGWFVPGRSPKTVILVHGTPAERSSLLELGRGPRARGFSLLFYDQRAHGQSGGEVTTLGYLEPHDLLGAVDYLRSRSDTANQPIGALGVSLGAASVIGAAALSPEIRAVAADSLFASLGEVIEER